MPLLESYDSDGIYHKLENSTICPLTSTMHMLQNGAMVSIRGAKQGGSQPPLNFGWGG